MSNICTARIINVSWMIRVLATMRTNLNVVGPTLSIFLGSKSDK